MEAVNGNFLYWAGYFFLILLRISSMFILCPFFGRNVPRIAKIVLSLMISYIVICLVPPQAGLVYGTILEYVLMCFKEISVGLIFGIVTCVFFYTITVSGQIIDLELGFSFAQLYDAQMGTQTAMTSRILNIIMLLVFFLVDGHHAVLKILCHTFSQIPPGAVKLNANIAKVFVEIFVMSFGLSVKLAMPILASGIMLEVLLGVIMRAIPQMNFFVIGFPVKIFLGLLIMAAFIPIFVPATNYIFDNMYDALQKILEGLSV